jgi:hypothetical protein
MKYMILMGEDWDNSPKHVGEGMTLADAIADLVEGVRDNGTEFEKDVMIEEHRLIAEGIHRYEAEQN